MISVEIPIFDKGGWEFSSFIKQGKSGTIVQLSFTISPKVQERKSKYYNVYIHFTKMSYKIKFTYQ